jgi:hypothetical protein
LISRTQSGVAATRAGGALAREAVSSGAVARNALARGALAREALARGALRAERVALRPRLRGCEVATRLAAARVGNPCRIVTAVGAMGALRAVDVPLA